MMARRGEKTARAWLAACRANNVRLVLCDDGELALDFHATTDKDAMVGLVLFGAACPVAYCVAKEIVREEGLAR